LIKAAATALLLVLTAAPLRAQLQVAVVRGTVVDGQGAPWPKATVSLTDSLGFTVARSTTDARGSFRIADVVPGAYTVRIEAGGATVASRTLIVRGALPIDITVRAGPTIHEDVVVRGDASSITADRPSTIAGDAVRSTLEPLPNQRVQAALSALPGWSAEDNGLLHVRGVDDGLLYVQDGIPVYERLDRLFGLPPNPSAIDSLHVIDGYIPPEFGFKAGSIVVARSISGLRGSWNGSIDAGLADLGTRYAQGFGAGPLSGSTALMVTASDERSSRFLDPVDLENLHNAGRSTAASAQLTWSGATGLLTSTLQGGRERYDVSNASDQDAAGQDQTQETSQVLLSTSWQRVRSDRTVWQLSGYARHAQSALLPSAFDTPVTAEARRINDRYGALASVTHQRSRHTIKVGGEAASLLLDERFRFAVTDPVEATEADLTDAAIDHTTDNPFEFADRRRPWLFALFAQDAYRISDRLTLSMGARFDRSHLLTETWQISPRAGFAYSLRGGTTLRASFMRLFQPPQAEYLLLSSSESARELSPFAANREIGGGSRIPPERQTAIEATVSQELPHGLRFDVGGWHRRGRDVDDPNVFGSTTIVFPNSVARQLASGFDVGIALLPTRGWSANARYSYARVEQFGPMTGGLFLDEEIAEIQDGTRFIPDHDQRHGVWASAGYNNERRGWRVSATFRYQSGTPLGVGDVDQDLLDRPGANTIDLESGRVRARAIADVQAEWAARRTSRADVFVGAWITNLTNQTYAFNFGNPFSGTHFGAGRRIGVSLRVVIGRPVVR